MPKASIGWMIGHFEPLHQGHVRIIQHAIGLVEQLHIVILEHPAPNPAYRVSLADKVRWMQRAFNFFPFVQVHSHAVPNPNAEHSDAQAMLYAIRKACGISDKAVLISDESHRRMRYRYVPTSLSFATLMIPNSRIMQPYAVITNGWSTVICWMSC